MMATLRQVTTRKKVMLEDDGIFGQELQLIAHDSPSEVHYDRAAEAVGMDRNLVPACSTIAELLAFVLSVKAAGGQEKAMAEFLDRFAPKASRNGAVDVNIASAAPPVASQNSAEQAAASNYMDALKRVK
jgi:hypothetical protein